MSARRLLLAPAALVSASLALAQQAPPGAPIVVEGTRNSDTQIRSFIKDLTPSYTRETLAKLPPGREKAIRGNVRSNEPDVKGIVGKLTQGAADAGFVYVTDVNATGGDLEAIDLPDELEPDVTYGAGVPAEARDPELGQEFLDGLTLGPCATALEEAGFGASP